MKKDNWKGIAFAQTVHKNSPKETQLRYLCPFLDIFTHVTSHILPIINLFASKLIINNNNIIFIQGKPLQCRNTVINGRKTGEHGEKPLKHGRDQVQQLHSHEFHILLRISTRLCPGGHPSSYNPIRPGSTWNSVVKGNALTESGIHVPKRATSSHVDIKLLGATL